MKSVFSIPIASLAKLVEVRCPGLCAETLFVLLLKSGAVLRPGQETADDNKPFAYLLIYYNVSHLLN